MAFDHRHDSERRLHETTEPTPAKGVSGAMRSVFPAPPPDLGRAIVAAGAASGEISTRLLRRAVTQYVDALRRSGATSNQILLLVHMEVADAPRGVEREAVLTATRLLYRE